MYESKRRAIEKNIEEANKSGNKLTQTMDADGNLIGVKETVDFESREVATSGGDPFLTRHPFKNKEEESRVEELEPVKEE